MEAFCSSFLIWEQRHLAAIFCTLLNYKLVETAFDGIHQVLRIVDCADFLNLYLILGGILPLCTFSMEELVRVI